MPHVEEKRERSHAGSPLTLWRAYVPRWAYLPLSGDGAARFGGRWNPVGAPTIYAARELSTCWAEYNQGFVQHPALIVQLRLSSANLVDLMDADTLSKLGLDPAIHACQWRDMMDRGLVPPTHALMAKLSKAGHDGVIFPSHMSLGGSCVALWRWGGAGEPVLEVIDPDQRLPKTPASWL